MKKLLLIVFSFSMGCSSATMIRSSDREAKIYINNEYKGKGAARYSDMKPVFFVNTVTLKKEGCKTQEHYFRRNDQVEPGAIIGGIAFLLPFLWAMKYKPIHTYHFDCKEKDEFDFE